MKVALIARTTLYDAPGGDTIQILQTAKHLQLSGVEARVCLTHEEIDYSGYDLFHFFNITRPADLIYHASRINKPYVISPIYIDYSKYDKHHRGGLSGLAFRFFSAEGIEYLKTTSRWVKGSDSLRSKKYLAKGQRRTIKKLLKDSALLLPNSAAEYAALQKKYSIEKNYRIVPNGTDTNVFKEPVNAKRDPGMVLCVARIEGIKNQLNLIKALNNTSFNLVIAGAPSPNQQSYYNQCRKMAGSNITFAGRLSQKELAALYAKAKVHVLPSWFETCGLSSLEAAAMGCNIVITKNGYTEDIFGPGAFYCDAGNPDSILKAIEQAAATEKNSVLQSRILEEYTWEKAAAITLEGYKKVLAG